MSESKNNIKGLVAAVFGLLLLASYGYKAHRAVEVLGGGDSPKPTATPRARTPSANSTAARPAGTISPSSSTGAKPIDSLRAKQRESELALLRLKKMQSEAQLAQLARENSGQKAPVQGAPQPNLKITTDFTAPPAVYNGPTLEERVVKLERKVAIAPGPEATFESRIKALETRAGGAQKEAGASSLEERVKRLEQRVAAEAAAQDKAAIATIRGQQIDMARTLLPLAERMSGDRTGSGPGKGTSKWEILIRADAQVLRVTTREMLRLSECWMEVSDAIKTNGAIAATTTDPQLLKLVPGNIPSLTVLVSAADVIDWRCERGGKTVGSFIVQGVLAHQLAEVKRQQAENPNSLVLSLDRTAVESLLAQFVDP